MCGRYFVEIDHSPALKDCLAQAQKKLVALAVGSRIACGEVSPGMTVLALARGKSGATGAFPMRWGYAVSGGKLVINARIESAANRPMFADSWKTRRCVVPANCYFEWERIRTQTSFLRAEDSFPAHGAEIIKRAIAPVNTNNFWLAALYRYEPNQTLPALVILTRGADASVARIHDRMPVMLDNAAAAEWLTQAAAPNPASLRLLTNMHIENSPSSAPLKSSSHLLPVE